MKEKKVKDSTKSFERVLRKPLKEKYVLRLYVTGMTPKSTEAIQNIKKSVTRKSMAGANTISEGLAKAKEMISTDPLGAKAKSEGLKAIVDKWENTFKTMAATPKKPEAVKKKAVNRKAAKKGEK
jgi:hypothetical protein